MQNNVLPSCSAMAHQWANILAHSGCTSTPYTELYRFLLPLTRQLLSALRADILDRAAIQTIGAALAHLCHADHEALRTTQELLAEYVLNVTDAEQRSLQHYLVPVLTELTVGFVRQSRVEYMLSHDELLDEYSVSEYGEQRETVGVKSLITKLPIIIFTTDRNGVITFVEGQVLERLGVTAHRLLGQSVSDICQRFFPADAQRILQHIDDTLGGSSRQSVGTAGDVVFEMHYDPIRDEHDNIVGVSGVALDITNYTQVVTELAETRTQLAERQSTQSIAHPKVVNDFRLSERDITVMRLIVAGKTNRAISQELKVSERTVGTITQSIIGKLGVKSRAEAISRATELGILRK